MMCGIFILSLFCYVIKRFFFAKSVISDILICFSHA